MPLRSVNPTSPGRRGVVLPSFEEITKSKPEKSLLAPLKKKGGRNSQGGLPCDIAVAAPSAGYGSLISSVTRSAFPARLSPLSTTQTVRPRIALIQYADGDKRYNLAPNGLTVGARIEAGPNAEVKVGNALR